MDGKASATESGKFGEDRKVRNLMGTKGSLSGNVYHCAMEKNQNGKYNIRIRVAVRTGRLVAVSLFPGFLL